MLKEKPIWDVYWEGPFTRAKAEDYEQKGYHVLYAVFGQHHMYGRGVLLYIGRSKNLETRLLRHAGWLQDEYDEVEVRIASVGPFPGWQEWSEDGDGPYPATPPDILQGVEALLIHAHQPAYNTQCKEAAPSAAEIRIFNTGHLGPLLPEVSYRYHLAED
jgi:hypothetical protein